MATSYNGWPATQSGAGIDTSFSAAGVKFPGGVLAGDVATIFRWLADRLNTIEPVVPGWCWGWEYRPNVNNPSTLSCHSSGTAIDWNAPNHPNGARGTWSASQVAAIRGWLGELGGVVAWGADFSGTKDEMHFEIEATAAQVATVAARLARDSGKTPPVVVQPPTPAQPGNDSEDEEMALSVIRCNGIDYAYSKTTGVFFKIRDEDHYTWLTNLGFITTPHGQAPVKADSEIEFARVECARAAGLDSVLQRVEGYPKA